ncbi:MAG: DNA-directed RNA polymerase subunit omega [Hyphomicrobiales bacterium]|nr:DNA-directed RNA polymerase subunit omega [Hyphomicrobiales bacterium]MCY4038058.1 DNA-directed RNA polymerase subunit omega [Hyphomicrobiales bacterium]
MARVTVEDCIEKVSNRFELVMLAVQRSRDISAGARPSLPRDGDKNPVIALREIAESSIEKEPLWDELAAYFRMPEAVMSAAADVTPDALLSASPEGGNKGASDKAGAEASKKDSGSADSDSSEDGKDETEGEQWSEEDMLRALQEMQGEPSP